MENGKLETCVTHPLSGKRKKLSPTLYPAAGKTYHLPFRDFNFFQRDYLPVMESSEGGLEMGSSAPLRKRDTRHIFSTTSSMRGRLSWLWSQHLWRSDTDDNVRVKGGKEGRS